jgi:hypothetical protein
MSFGNAPEFGFHSAGHYGLLKIVRRAVIAVGLLLVLISPIPAYFGANFILLRADFVLIVLGAVLVVISGSTMAGGFHLAKIGIFKNEPEPLVRSSKRSASIFLGVALAAGSWFLFICALMIWEKAEAVLWSLAYLTLGCVCCTLGAVSLCRSRSADAWAIPKEPDVIIPEYQENLPVVPPEPDLLGLLQVKKTLKEQGRT